MLNVFKNLYIEYSKQQKDFEMSGKVFIYLFTAY